MSRELATSLVDTLQTRGHILVVKGSSAALARELDEIMSPVLIKIAPQLQPRAIVGGEVTSTFGHDAVDEAVEHMVMTLVKTLMDSEHVEDVFAEDNVIRRDIFRVVRDRLLSFEPVIEDETSIRVRLDTLGYVAKSVGQRADLGVLKKVLQRAAEVVAGQLGSFDPQAREATFMVQDSDPDLRLELEEAVDDELRGLVASGAVELPTIQRQVTLTGPPPASIAAPLRRQIEIAANRMLRRTGCRAAWELTGGRTLKVTFTPLSEQDARDAEAQIVGFARELDALLAEAQAPAPVPRAKSSRRSAAPATAEPAESVEATPPAPPREHKPEGRSETPKARSKPVRRTPAAKPARPAAKAKSTAKRAAPKRTKTAAALPQKKTTRKTSSKRTATPAAKVRKTAASKTSAKKR